MFETGIALVVVLASLSAFNANRSRVRTTRMNNVASADTYSQKQQPFFLDIASTYPDVMSMSEYFVSLKFDKPLTLRGLLVSLAATKFSNNLPLRWLALIILGAIPFLGYIKLASKPVDMISMIERIAGVYSIGIFASIADAVHHVKPFKIKPGEDAVVKFKRHIRCEPSLPHYDPLDAFPRALAAFKDELTVPAPQPFLPDVLPGLCVGWGGLKPMQTEKTSARNALVAEMMNRLSANVLVYADVLEPADLFIVRWREDSIRTVEDFVTKIPGVEMFFSKNSSSFGFMLCVQDDAGSNKYKQLPIAWTGRTALRDPDTGDQLSALSYHSSLVITGNDECPLGTFRVQFFLGPEGVTGWKAGNEYLKPWAPIVSAPKLNREQTVEACRVSTCVSCAINLASRTQNLAVGGYALHGTCLDIVAIVKSIVLGSMDDFPLIASGDARAGTIAACHRLAEALNGGNGPTWAKDTFKKVGDVVARLPDDTSIPPTMMISTIDRFQASVMGDFVLANQVKAQLSTIRTKWKKILRSE